MQSILFIQNYHYSTSAPHHSVTRRWERPATTPTSAPSKRLSRRDGRSGDGSEVEKHEETASLSSHAPQREGDGRRASLTQHPSRPPLSLDPLAFASVAPFTGSLDRGRAWRLVESPAPFAHPRQRRWTRLRPRTPSRLSRAGAASSLPLRSCRLHLTAAIARLHTLHLASSGDETLEVRARAASGDPCVVAPNLLLRGVLML